MRTSRFQYLSFAVALFSFFSSHASVSKLDLETGLGHELPAETPVVTALKSWSALPEVLKDLNIEVGPHTLFGIDFDDTLVERRGLFCESPTNRVSLIALCSAEVQRQHLGKAEEALLDPSRGHSVTLEDYMNSFAFADMYVQEFSPAEDCLFEVLNDLVRQKAHLHIFSGMRLYDSRRLAFLSRLEKEVCQIPYTYSPGTKFEDMRAIADEIGATDVIYIDNFFDSLPDNLDPRIKLIHYTGVTNHVTPGIINSELRLFESHGKFRITSPYDKTYSSDDDEDYLLYSETYDSDSSAPSSPRKKGSDDSAQIQWRRYSSGLSDSDDSASDSDTPKLIKENDPLEELNIATKKLVLRDSL